MSGRKTQLLKQVWPDSFVEEANLSHQIYKLREALSDGEAQPVIQTCRGAAIASSLRSSNGCRRRAEHRFGRHRRRSARRLRR
jgi:DNA-binding winged helix-turn-helix (wHTH) protein